MSSYNNFSKKDRARKDSNYNTNPDNFEVRKVNKDKIKSFEKLKPKWRELCSYFRFYPDRFIDFIQPDDAKIKLYFYQRIYLRIMFRFRKVFITATRGTSKCVTGDTLLFTDNGIKEIGELASYSTKKSKLNCNIKLLNGFNKMNNANAIFINGKRDTKKISTSDGYEIEGTYNHPVLIMDESGKYDFKNLEDVKIGDYIAISRGSNIFGNNTKIDINIDKFLNNRTKEDNKSLVHCNIPNKLTNDLAYYFGLLIGDGCLTRDNVVLFTSADKELADFFININKNVFSIDTKKNKKYNYIVYSMYFREVLRQIGLDKVNAFEKEIPKCILNAPKEIVTNFLSGLFDTDGMVDKNHISFCTASEKMSKQIQIILANLGIISNRKKRFNKKFKTYHYIINIYGKNIDLFKENIGFKLKRKQVILNSIYKYDRNPNKNIIPYQEDKIIKITNKNKYQNSQYLKQDFYHIRAKNNKLTYDKLRRLYDYNIDMDSDYASLIDLDNLNYYWDEIVEIKNNENYVYDINVKKSHTFVGNAIVNHNSFLQNLAFVLLCIMYPRTKLFCCAPGKEQAAKITQECLDDIFDFFPLLGEEVKIFKREKDYTKLVFYNGSKYDVVQMKDSSRGGRRFGGVIEEIADKKFDGDILNSVVIPLMANSRTAMCGKVDPNEIHKREIYITTASTQQQFAYAKCKEIFDDMMNGDSAFCTGNSYELPCMYGQLDIDFIEEKRDSPTYSILDFMREYESIYTGSSSDNLISDEKLNKCRTLSIAEWEHCGDTKVQYVLSYDVSRSTGKENALCALVVIKLTPRGDGTYHKQIVNIFSSEGQHDTWQAKFLKEKVREYKASILVIDANGIGSGVVDQLVLDLNDGNPPYKVVNDIDNQWTKYETQDAIPMVYALKSQRKETKNSDMINNIMKVFNKLDVELLKTPNEGLKELEKKNKKKFKDDSEEIALAEIPYILTNNLCDEIMNLLYKQRGNDSEVEQISRSIPKDKFSALMYGLYWVYLEEKKNKISKKQKFNWLDYVLY